MTAAREQCQLPEIAPKGFYFYLATTPSPTDKGRRHLYAILRPKQRFGEVRVTLSPERNLAKPFDRLALARAYADFLNRMDGLLEFRVVLEAGRVLDSPNVPNVTQNCQLMGSLTKYSEFRWEWAVAICGLLGWQGRSGYFPERVPASDRLFRVCESEASSPMPSGEWQPLKQFVEVNPIGSFWRQSREPLALRGTG